MAMAPLSRVQSAHFPCALLYPGGDACGDPPMDAELGPIVLGVLNVVQLALLVVASREARRVKSDLCSFLAEWQSDRSTDDGDGSEPGRSTGPS